jgi:signal transduction histidine kinase
LHVDVPAGIAMDSYPLALAQVLTNLAVNALQHAFVPGRPGSIMVTARLSDDDDAVQLAFGDDGQGVDAALRDRIFEPFFTTRRMHGGTGLGLYIVNQLVARQLGGTIALGPAAGGGTRFDMRLPRVARQAPDVMRMFANSLGADADER